MNRKEFLHALEFKNYLLFDHQVHLVSTIKMQALICDREFDLPFKAYARQVQFLAQTFLIRRFQQPGPELAMDFNRRSDDGTGSRISLFAFSVSL